MNTMANGTEYFRDRIQELAALVSHNPDRDDLLEDLRLELNRRKAALKIWGPLTPLDLLDSLNGVLFALDQEWRFTYGHEREATQTGLTPADLAGSNIWERYPHLVGSDLERIFRSVMSGGEPGYLEMKSRRGAWYEVRAYPNSNGITVFVVEKMSQKQTDIRRNMSIERLGRLVEISARIMGNKTVESLLQAVAQSALDLIGAHASVALELGEASRKRSASSGSMVEGELEQMLALAENAEFQKQLDGQPALHLHLAQLAGKTNKYGLAEKDLVLNGVLAANLAVPGGPGYGAILVSGGSEDEFTIEDEYLLSQLATLSSLALQNIQSVEQARYHADELDTLFNTVSDALLVYDASGQLVRANPAAQQLFSGAYPPVSHTGQEPDSALEIFDPDTGQPLSAEHLPVQAAMTSGKPAGWTRIHCHLPDGRQIEMNVSASPLVDESGILSGVVSIWHDITDLQQSRWRAEQEANRAGLLAEELNSIFAAMADSVMVFDVLGNPVRLNPGAHSLYDFDVIRMPLEETMTRINLRKMDGTPYTVAELPSQRALRGELVMGERAIQARSDGTDVVILSSAAPVYDSAGVIKGSVVVWHDVTEFEHIQQEFRRQRLLLEQIVEEAPVGIALMEGPEHRYALTNPAFRSIIHAQIDLTGYTPAEIWPHLAGQFVPILDRVFDTATAYAVQDFPAPVEPGEAEPVYINYSYTPLLGENGRVESILAILADTTEQVQTKRQLEQERAFLKAVIDFAPMAIVFVDHQARVLGTNPEADYLYNRPVPYGEDYPAHASMNLCYPDGRLYDPRDLPLTRAALDGETYRDVDMGILWPDGRRRDLKVNAAPIYAPSGKIIGAVGAFMDVTDANRFRRHDHFLAGLGPELLTQTNPDRIFTLITRRLREYFQANRVMLNEIDPAFGWVAIHEDHLPGIPALPDRFDLRQAPQALTASIRQGQPFISFDAAADGRLESMRELLAQNGFAAAVVVPRLKENQWLLTLSVSSPVPRHWHDDEIALVGSVADLTWLALERSRLVKNLRDSEYRFRRLFDSNVIGISYSRGTGIVMDANDAFLAIIGYSRADLEARRIDWRQLTPPEYLYLDNQGVAESMERGYCTPFEKEYIRKDGQRVPVLIGFSPLNETAEEFVCFVLDMSEQKRYRDALRESQRRLDLALRGSPVVMFVQDAGLRYTWIFNPPAFKEKNVIGLTDADLFEPQDAAAMTELKRRVLETGKGLRQDITVQIGGSTVIYDLTIEPQLDERGAVKGVVSIALDLTEHYRLETEMRHHAAHVEIQHAILQHYEQERLQIARDLQDRLLPELESISSGLLEWAHTGDRRLRLSQTSQIHASLKQQIQNLRIFCSELYPPALPSSGLETALRSLILDFQSRNPQIKIYLDLVSDGNALAENTRLTIFRISQELLNNVARHANASNVRVRFSLTADRVQLAVEDDGQGFVLPEQWIHLAREGHFGLVEILEQVEALNGELAVDSKPGGGTHVFVNIPLESGE